MTVSPDSPSDSPPDSRIVRLKITLDDVKPAVVRRIEVPIAIKLSNLHLVIQSAMPWLNYHLYEFRVRDTGWGIPNPEFGFGGGPLDARKVTLQEVLGSTGAKTLKYLYDFGDGWEHAIKVESPAGPEPGATYPRLIDAKGRCPPEDVGGPPGYQEYLEAIADPEHERHEELIHWGGAFDPNAVDTGQISKEFAALAKKFSRKPAPRKSKVAKE